MHPVACPDTSISTAIAIVSNTDTDGECQMCGFLCVRRVVERVRFLKYTRERVERL